ncbi:hypothetical protein FIBSPDRAFT_965274 [Athelia psychrophila]|uniref:F-box domain-containing protein n=1 Tax=Athelia psychrophila TaxID=1759441 RepID=A0A165WT69_9AGAM|nr:hypothetical protein FIBSPDRAFT_965274 [Fibularhizoctonia sp. CBS 109695]
MLAYGMGAVASLSNLRSIGLRGPLIPDPDDASWLVVLSTLLATFAHLTDLKINDLDVVSLPHFAALVGTCSELQTLIIRMCCLSLDSSSHPYIPQHFPPPGLRSVRPVEHREGQNDSFFHWLSTAAKPLPIVSIVLQTFGKEYIDSVTNLLRDAGPFLECLAINTEYITSWEEGQYQPPLPDLNLYPRLQSFTCSWNSRLRRKSAAVQEADICRAIGQISSHCMKTIEIIIDTDHANHVNQLNLRKIDRYLQRPNFASLESLTLVSLHFYSEIVEDWAWKTFPICFQRGILKLRDPIWWAWLWMSP